MKMKHKICPLFYAARLTRTGDDKDADKSAAECLALNCQWFDPDDLACGIRLIADNLNLIIDARDEK